MVKYNQTNIALSDYNMSEIKKIIESGEVVNGIYIDLLKKNLQVKTKVKYVIPCANCTTGLIIALKAAGLQGKTIAVPAFTWFSTPYAITCSYNIPYFVDINKDTWLMEDFNEKFVDAILSVDILGSRSFSKANLPIIYDAAHGYDIPDLGHRGLLEVISFSYTKVVQGMQGGAILTNNEELAERCNTMVHRYGKMNEISAFIICKSMNDWSRSKKTRDLILQKYRELIKIPYREQRIETFTNYSVYSLLFETAELRDKIREALTKNKVETKIYYQPVVEDSEYFRRMLPNTFDIYSRSLSLPLYPLIINDVEFICKIINGAI